jgi:hypothetical protein
LASWSIERSPRRARKIRWRREEVDVKKLSDSGENPQVLDAMRGVVEHVRKWLTRLGSRLIGDEA